MPTKEFIIRLFCRVDDELNDVGKHPQAKLYPSEVVTLALLFSIKGVGNRAFYRWINKNWRHFFPNLPHRTRLFRLFNSHRELTERFMGDTTVMGIIDSYGIELIHPIREGRSPQQIGKKGKSNYRWIVGCKLCLLINQYGRVVDWDCDTANVHDNTFQPLIEQFEDEMIVFSDTHFHAADGDPANLKLCERGEWNDRMLIETVLSMLTLVCHFKKVMHRVWDYFESRLAYTMAAFNVLVDWNGLQVDQDGYVRLSIAEFSL